MSGSAENLMVPVIEAPRSCCGGGLPKILGGDVGMIFPLGGDWEAGWPTGVKIILYLVALLWCFVGVAIIADTFMGAIEKVTSKKVTKKDPHCERNITKNVWNETVANLTLMALGSSAPEILLNVISVFNEGYHAESLGPGTIVGSAAFNLLVITAVCVACLPHGQSRYVQQVGVLLVTSFFSVFAYLWLLFILLVSTPDIVEPWEGILTFIFFPLLTVVAYMVDVGYIQKLIHGHPRKTDKLVLTEDTTDEEKEIMRERILEKYGEEARESMDELMIYEFKKAESRMAHRSNAIRSMTGGRKVLKAKASDAEVMSKIKEGSRRASEQTEEAVVYDPHCQVQFKLSHYVVLESKEKVTITVKRTGTEEGLARSGVKVDYTTKAGTAEAGSDFVNTQGTLEFGPGETEKSFEIKIIDDNAEEPTEEFYVVVQNPVNCSLGEQSEATVVIIDAERPGKLAFAKDDLCVIQRHVPIKKTIVVKRTNGSAGTVGCSYYTEDDSAHAGLDYDEAKGELVFQPQQMESRFTLNILPARAHEASKEVFRVILSDPTGGARFDCDTDGGANRDILTVTIAVDPESRSKPDVYQRLGINHDSAVLGVGSWKEQFSQAIFVGGSREEQKQCSWSDFTLHIISTPWKVLFAFVPPTEFAGGWACFAVSLIMIGFVTCLIGDLANLLGCAMDVKQGIVAITFVALGTSLPDTFASMTATAHDQYADAAIGNVTGSNSVNVFLGLGLPWSIGAIYWSLTDVDLEDLNDPWVKRGVFMQWPPSVSDYVRERQGKGVFVVIANNASGNLAVSVATFCCCATACLATLALRRKFIGAELGGPAKSAYATSAFFVLLWFVYLVMACKDGLTPFCDTCESV